MFCSEIMTRNPECVTPNDSVMKAAQLMKSEDVGPIPIVKDGRKLEGIITDRDLALKVVAEGRDPKTTPVEAVMTDNLVTCKGNDDVQKVLTLMQKHQVRRIPVVDNEDQLIGIIAQADVATRLGNNSATGQMVEDISH
jgi:CBS domain-containing protein